MKKKIKYNDDFTCSLDREAKYREEEKKDYVECRISKDKEKIAFSSSYALKMEEVSQIVWNIGKKNGTEILSVECVDPTSNNVIEIRNILIGNKNSVPVPDFGRVCPIHLKQYLSHSHPSGISKFSPLDGYHSVDRINRGYDDRHYVFGQNEMNHIKYNISPCDTSKKR